MSTLNIKQGGTWTPIAGDVNASNPINDFISANTPTPWTNLTLVNGWTTDRPAQYRKIGDIVYLRGRVTGGANGTVIGTLPTGFRPAINTDFIAHQWPSNQNFVNVNVGFNGDITMFSPTAVPTPQYVSITQIFFSILT